MTFPSPALNNTIKPSYPPRKRLMSKGRKTSGQFLMLMHDVLHSKQFGNLSPYGLKLLIELASLYNRKNNGNLSASYRILKKRGWRSSGTLNKAIKELENYGWIIKTRQGGKNLCSLYAITWWGIDDCKGIHCFEENPVPRNDWKNWFL